MRHHHRVERATMRCPALTFGFGRGQAYSYWLLGACLAKNDSTLSARYTGCYKGAQSIGAAVA
eukprot:3935672-Rhodomonas_salina.1